MESILIPLFLAILIAIIVGLIKPNLVRFWSKNATRGQILFIYGFGFIAFFIAVSLGSDSEKQAPKATPSTSDLNQAKAALGIRSQSQPTSVAPPTEKEEAERAERERQRMQIIKQIAKSASKNLPDHASNPTPTLTAAESISKTFEFTLHGKHYKIQEVDLGKYFGCLSNGVLVSAVIRESSGRKIWESMTLDYVKRELNPDGQCVSYGTSQIKGVISKSDSVYFILLTYFWGASGDSRDAIAYKFDGEKVTTVFEFEKDRNGLAIEVKLPLIVATYYIWAQDECHACPHRWVRDTFKWDGISSFYRENTEISSGKSGMNWWVDTKGVSLPPQSENQASKAIPTPSEQLSSVSELHREAFSAGQDGAISEREVEIEATKSGVITAAMQFSGLVVYNTLLDLWMFQGPDFEVVQKEFKALRANLQIYEGVQSTSWESVHDVMILHLRTIARLLHRDYGPTFKQLFEKNVIRTLNDFDHNCDIELPERIPFCVTVIKNSIDTGFQQFEGVIKNAPKSEPR